MSKRPFGAAQPLLLPRPDPRGAPEPAPLPHSPSSSGACCSPPWLLYLFILHQQGCCRLILAWFKKRERKKKEKCFLALFLPRSWQQRMQQRQKQQADRRTGGQAGRRAGGQVGRGAVGVSSRGRCEPRCSLNGTGPQPWTDAAPNLMQLPSFSGKCPHLPSQPCYCPPL